MSIAKSLLKEGEGILRLAPTWVPRAFCRPGKRIKLHPDDYYVRGLEKGGIDERWFASTTWAENGPDTPADEGLSYVVSADGNKRMLLRVARIIRTRLKAAYYGAFHTFFFDGRQPICRKEEQKSPQIRGFQVTDF